MFRTGLRLSGKLGSRIALRNVVTLASKQKPFVTGFQKTIPIRTYATDRLGEQVDDKVDNLSPKEYDDISNSYLEDLCDEIDIVSEKFPDIDFELSQGVMTLTLPSGTYVINRQPPSKQIWLSSPMSGPNRYDMVGGKWISLRDETSLTELLSAELTETLSYKIDLDLEY